MDFQVIAHRGGAGDAPENTLEAFENAARLGVCEVEFDVRMSRDGELVLFHDAELWPKTTLAGRVSDREAAELLAADIGSWFDATHPGGSRRYAGTTLTTLGRVLARFGHALRYHIEIKGEQEVLPDRVLAIVCECGLASDVVLTSFEFDPLVRVREIAPDVATCLLLRDPRRCIAAMPAARRAVLIELQRERIDRAVNAGFQMVGLRASLLSPEIVAYARSRGLAIRAWGVASDVDMEHAIEVGVDGMTIDWPLRLAARLGKRGVASNVRTRE